jgi:DNA-damage-inducible protein J
MVQESLRIDDKLKEEADSLFNVLGIPFSSAVNLLIRQAVREQAVPFRVIEDKPKSITLASENALAKEWLLPEEDAAWMDL